MKRNIGNANGGLRYVPQDSSVYPLHPPGSQVLLRVSENELSLLDRLLVAGSSVFIVGSVFWIPAALSWAWKRWSKIPREDKKRRTLYATMILACLGLLTVGPHRSEKAGQRLKVRRWKLWTSWLRFIAMEVVSDQPESAGIDTKTDSAILAFVPHGIFPFAFAFGVLPELAQKAFGVFRPVVATATQLFPIVRDIISWTGPVDASRHHVEKALAQKTRLGLVPGGIAEMFEGYPKPSAHPDEEYAIVRKGFLRMAMKHGVPVIPVYCFGSTKMLHRLQLPLLERLSNFLRVSICVFYGVWGLPIPFRQKLLYVMGQPILPTETNRTSEAAVEDMQNRFCEELVRIFNRHKESYGWSHKTLKLITK